MSPRAKRQARSHRTRPYGKKIHPSSVTATPGTSTSVAPPGRSPTPTPPALSGNILPDRHGYPTQAQFSEALKRYMTSLHPRKAVKALIDREMYDKIHGSLSDPTDHKIGNAQFRFWVRKMFTLQHVPGYSGPYTENIDPFSRPLVVVHENRPVAMKDELYSVLCHCHGLAQHGGRDRTCAVVRSLYSYVPKVLIAAFVATCPTCQYRRTGDPTYIPFMEEPAAREEKETALDDRTAGNTPEDDGKKPDMGYFGPGPEYPFHNGSMFVTPELSHPTFLPPWSSLPLPALRPLAHRDSSSSSDTHTRSVSTLMTPDMDDHLPITLPPLHLPPTLREVSTFQWNTTGPFPRPQSWDVNHDFSPFSIPSSIPSSPRKHRLPSVSQLLRMEGVDGESYVHGRGDEDVRLPRLVEALTDEGILRRFSDPYCSDIPVDPLLLGENGSSATGHSGLAQCSQPDHNTTIVPMCPNPQQPAFVNGMINHVPLIMVTGSPHAHARPPPLDLSRISTLHSVHSWSLSPSSASPLSSDRSNLPTGSSISFDCSTANKTRSGGRTTKSKGKRKGKKREGLEDDQNTEYQVATSSRRQRHIGPANSRQPFGQ